MADSSIRLQLTDISKRYPNVVANSGIDLSVRPGEVHALLGENGAGKSTLVKIIYGVVKPDSGTLYWEGKPVQLASPAQARKLGIAMVFQHFSLFESLTVVENIALGMNYRGRSKQLATEIREVSQRYGLAVEPDREVHTLAVGERQRVEIIRCLLQHPTLLIMDEPTSVLTPQAAQELFKTLKRLAGEGMSILYISHKLDEVRALCETATVLRGGKVSAHCDPRQESAASLARLMIGSTLPVTQRPATVTGDEVLRVNTLSLTSPEPFGTDLHAINLSIAAGEIVGIAGVAGNGQKELLAAISGEQLSGPDTVYINGESVGDLRPAARRRRGLAFVPEERLGRGAVPEMNLADNALLTSPYLALGGWIRFGKLRRFAEQVRKDFRVVASSINVTARSLSGGNLQKYIVGREILHAPRLLVAAHPTWGVDVGAAGAIHQALMDLRSRGAGVLVISEDLDELLAISDRIAVLSAGRLSVPRETSATSLEELGLKMGGGGAEDSGEFHYNDDGSIQYIPVNDAP